MATTTSVIENPTLGSAYIPLYPYHIILSMTFELLLSCFILIIPLLGKAINYGESLILYGGIVILLSLSLFHHPPRYLTKKFIILETILVLLTLLSTIFSPNIGYSYYGFFNFIFSLILLNLCLSYLETKKLSMFILYFSLFYSLIFLLNKFNFLTLPISSSSDNFILQVWGHSYLADLLIFSIPFLLYQIIYSKFTSPKQKYFYYFSFIFISLITFLTNSRSALIAVTLSTIYIVLPKIPKYLRLLFVFLLISLTVFLNYRIFSQSQKNKTFDGNRFEYWQQAAKAFLDRPLLGYGPNNFFYINKKYENVPFTNTNYAHNSVLEFLCLNGLPFTFLIFYLIALSLLYQQHHYRLNFAIALTVLINSFLDPGWNSMGIFCLSLFFIFTNNHQIVSSSNIKTEKASPYKLIVLILISVFFLSKTTSDLLFVSHKFIPSLYADPFNLNPRLTLLPDFTPSTIFLYSHDFRLYEQLVKINPLPTGEKYNYQLFSLLPRENSDVYLKLASYHLQNKNYDAFNELTADFLPQFSPNTVPLKALNIIYKAAVTLYPIDKNKSIFLFELLVKYYPNDGFFQTDLANAYWNNGQIDSAFNSLYLCLDDVSAHNQCQEYLDIHKNNESFNQPGQSDYLDYVDWQFPIN